MNEEIMKNIDDFIEQCKNEELSERTLKKYRRDVKEFIETADIKSKEDITKDKLIDYKDQLVSNSKTSTVNNKIIIINKFLVFLFNNKEYNLKQIKTQNKFEVDNILNTTDYKRLLDWAMRLNKTTMYYLMRTLAGTGIRISELEYITVEAVKRGKTEVYNKEKKRPVYIKESLQKELKRYCKDRGIKTGAIFISRNGKPLDNAYIYKEIQYIAGQARVKKSKAHPHSFRHLFAKEYLNAGGNYLNLADILGHSSTDTTRIYSTKDSNENRADLNKMNV